MKGCHNKHDITILPFVYMHIRLLYLDLNNKQALVAFGQINLRRCYDFYIHYGIGNS